MRVRTAKPIYACFLLGFGGITSGNPEYVLLGIGLIALGLGYIISIVKNY